jgi:hypothetical protein
MSKKDANQLVKDLRRYFKAEGLDYTLEIRGGHWHVVNAAGKSLVRFASTPSEHRFRQNETAALRRAGIVSGDFR